MKIVHAFFAYLRANQPPAIRYLHLIVLLAVISQILSSNFIHFTDNGAIGSGALTAIGTRIHIITGLTLLPIALIFALVSLKKRGFKYFYAYLFGDFAQIKADIAQLLKFKLPDPQAGGLAASVMGLGLGALFLALLSGLAWFIAWQNHFASAESLGNFHRALVGLIEIYLVGHGAMALLHIYFFSKRGKSAASQ